MTQKMTALLDSYDFNFGYRWAEGGDVMYVNHLWFAEEHRRQGHGSFVIETLVRVAYSEGAEVVEVSIGGGDGTASWLRHNGFHILRRRSYESGEGVDAVRKV